MYYINGTNNQSESELIDLSGICQKTYSTLDELKEECDKFKISYAALNNCKEGDILIVDYYYVGLLNIFKL